MDKKKIIFMIHDLGGGGAEKVLINMVNNMDQDKFDITILALFGGGVNEQFIKPGIRYKYIWKKAFPMNTRILSFFSAELLHKLIVKDRYDIEIAYLEGSPHRIISGCPAKATKLIAWQHSWPRIEKSASVGFRNIEEARHLYTRYHSVVCVSEDIKNAVAGWHPEVKRLDVLYNVNETDKILQMAEETLDESQTDVREIVFDDNEFKICCVGKLEQLKRFDRLLYAHKKLTDEGIRIHTYLIGEGSQRETLQKYCADNGIEDTVTFLGYQENPYKYMAKCDAFACTSDNEGFSTATTEALILGLAAISTPVSGARELLGESGEYGIITAMSDESVCDAVRKLAKDKKILIKYQEKARERGKMFSTQELIAKAETYFEKVASE